MAQIAIITSTSLPQGDMIFRGVYGRLTELVSAEAGQAPSRSFSVAPELRPVSTLFSYLENGSAPVTLDQFQTIEVPEADVARVQDQLMYELQKRWRGMYKALAPSADSMIGTMLKGEGATVERAVNAHFGSQNKTLWRVPVTATMKTGADGAYLTSEQALLETMASQPAASVSLLDAPVTAHTEGAESLTLPAPVADPESGTPAWSDFMGVEAHVEGYMVVVASSEQDARQAARAILAVGVDEQSQAQGLRFNPSVVATQVLATRALTMVDAVSEADADSNGSDEDEDDGEDSPRGHYRF